MIDFPVITGPSGMRYALVPSHRIERWTADDAMRMLDRLEDGPFLLHALARLVGSDDLGPLDREDTARRVAEQIERGWLVPVALEEPRMVGRPILHWPGRTPQRGSSDEIVPLSSLRETEPTLEYGWVSIELVDGRGRPFAGFEVTLVHADGRRDRVVLDDVGRHTARRVLLPGPSRIELPPRVELPATAAKVPAMDGFVRRADDIVVARRPSGPIELTRLDRHYRLVAADVHAVTEIPIDGWAQGSAVMRWGGMRSRNDGTVATTRAALRLALWRGRGRTLAVAGHADALGQDSDNDALSLERARSVQLFAAGKLDVWAEHAFAHANGLDLQCALVACQASAGVGSIALGDDDAMSFALAALRRGAGLAEQGSVTVEDWRAIADVYDVDLARMLATDRAGLAEIRAAVKWAEPPVFALGERWPRPASELTDVDPAAVEALPHRRSSLLVFESTDDVDAAIASVDVLYDGTFVRTVLPIPGEVRVRVIAHTTALDGLGAAAIDLEIAELGTRRVHANADGIAIITVLRGDRIRITGGRRADGGGRVLEFGAAELGGFD